MLQGRARVYLFDLSRVRRILSSPQSPQHSTHLPSATSILPRLTFSTNTKMSTSTSAAKLIPSDPSKVMVIRDVTPTITTFSTPFLRFSRIKVGGRGTLVKLQSGSLAVFSPVALTPEVKQKVESMGTLKYIIAPDMEHHIFVSPWSAAYPSAEIIGPEGLPEKRESDPATKGYKFAHVFQAKSKTDMRISPEFDAEFDYEFVDSHINKELVFLHKPTKTMIEADYIFNLPATEQFSRSGVKATGGILTSIFCALQSTQGSMIWQKRFWWYAASSKDRKGFKQSLDRIQKWDFDRIIPCHGDVIETGGKRILGELGKWFEKV